MNAPMAVSVRYTLDGEDCIDSIQGEWDEFANANAAPELRRDQVLGSSIWQFIDGADTAEIHRLLFQGVRTRGLRVSLPFRCDGPQVRRDMRMDVSPVGNDGIEVRSVLVKERQRRYTALLDGPARRSNELVKVCSWCKKVALPGGGWVEVEDAIRALRLLDFPPVPRISHGMCEECLTAFRQQLGAPVQAAH